MKMHYSGELELYFFWLAILGISIIPLPTTQQMIMHYSGELELYFFWLAILAQSTCVWHSIAFNCVVQRDWIVRGSCPCCRSSVASLSGIGRTSWFHGKVETGDPGETTTKRAVPVLHTHKARGALYLVARLPTKVFRR